MSKASTRPSSSTASDALEALGELEARVTALARDTRVGLATLLSPEPSAFSCEGIGALGFALPSGERLLVVLPSEEPGTALHLFRRSKASFAVSTTADTTRVNEHLMPTPSAPRQRLTPPPSARPVQITCFAVFGCARPATHHPAIEVVTALVVAGTHGGHLIGWNLAGLEPSGAATGQLDALWSWQPDPGHESWIRNTVRVESLIATETVGAYTFGFCRLSVGLGCNVVG